MSNPTNNRTMTTKNLAYCALLAALSVVLARLIIPMPNAPPVFPMMQCRFSWPVCSSTPWLAAW